MKEGFDGVLADVPIWVEYELEGKACKTDVKNDLAIGEDISDEMNKVAAQMGFYGSLYASASAKVEEMQVAYRKWRAEQTGAILKKIDPKLPEWKVSMLIEQTGEFAVKHNAISDAERRRDVLRAVYEAFRVKANMLQSKGAMLRAELDATGMSTPESRKEGKKEALRQARQKV